MPGEMVGGYYFILALRRATALFCRVENSMSKDSNSSLVTFSILIDQRDAVAANFVKAGQYLFNHFSRLMKFLFGHEGRLN
jgi:hypothetical protein